MASGIIVANHQGKILTASAEASRLLGLKAGEENPGASVLPESLRKLVSRAASGGTAREHEVTIAGPRGKEVPVLVNLLTSGAARKGCDVVLTLTDLSRVRDLEQRFERLNRLATTGTLSAGLAHEAKNALVAAKTFVDLLLEKQPGSNMGEIVRRELKRADALLTQVLNFSALGKPALAPVPVHKLLDHSLQLLNRQLQDKSIALARQYAAPTDMIQGDDDQLEQAFLNLLLNALDAMPPHGALTVATGAEPVSHATGGLERLSITIRDNGSGIPKENLRKLFEPFFTTKDGGTGLGLAITRRIIIQHGGRIAVDSQPGEGTAFQIVLPTLSRTA